MKSSQRKAMFARIKAKKYKYAVARTVMAGYEPDFKYFRTLKEAKWFVRNSPNYPVVRRYVYKIDKVQ